MPPTRQPSPPPSLDAYLAALPDAQRAAPENASRGASNKAPARPKTTRAPTRAEAAPAGIGDGAAEVLAWLERTGSAKAKGDMARYASDEHLLG